MNKRLTLGLVVGALVAAMVPGAVAATAPSSWTVNVIETQPGLFCYFGTFDDPTVIGVALSGAGANWYCRPGQPAVVVNR